MTTHTIAPRSGVAFELMAGDRLSVIDPQGMQVADLLAFNRADVGEAMSNGRSFDYEETIRLTTGNRIWSNRSNILLTIEEDMVGVHDFLLTPCSVDTFAHFYPDKPVAPGCFGNLVAALAPYGISRDMIPVAFNCFMNVPVDDGGRISVLPPPSRAGDKIVFRAEMDLIIGLTACSAYASNGGSFKPIDYVIEAGASRGMGVQCSADPQPQQPRDQPQSADACSPDPGHPEQSSPKRGLLDITHQ